MSTIGTFGDSIRDVSRKISKSSVGEFYGKFLKQDSDELANMARKTMQKNVDASSFINKEALQNIINDSPAYVSGNKDYIGATKQLMSSLDKKDMEKATETAMKISDNFKEDAYLEMLKKAEQDKIQRIAQFDSMDSDDIRRAFVANQSFPGFVDKIATEDQQRGMKNLLYSTQGKKGYFNSGDVKKNQARVATAAGVYMAGMTTARLSHGGSLTRNEYGERDIVGIPFI